MSLVIGDMHGGVLIGRRGVAVTGDAVPDRQTKQRLEALAAYEILDTAPEEGFDDIVFIASHVCTTPVALVSLVTDERQWFKARFGVDVCETPIGQSVCAHGLDSDELLVIPDLTIDPRTADNALVTGPPHIRFYAGAPLVTPQGVVIGMLCVIDVVPRPNGLTDVQRKVLRTLAHQVVTQLELRRTANRALAAQDAAGMGVFELDIAANSLTASPEFCRIFGLPVTSSFPVEQLEAMVQIGPASSPSTAASRAAGTADSVAEYGIRRADDQRVRWIRRRAEFVYDEHGMATHMIGAVQDVTDQQVINEEIGHRLKNSLSLVQAIAQHSLREFKGSPALAEFDRRLVALATGHDVLLRRTRRTGFFAEIVDTVLTKAGVAARSDAQGDEIELGTQSTLALSMLLHELATNSMKYGALSVPGGVNRLRWLVEGEETAAVATFTWTEHGGPQVAKPERRGFGSRLIERGFGSGSKVDVTYGQDGLSVTVRTPLALLNGQ